MFILSKYNHLEILNYTNNLNLVFTNNRYVYNIKEKRIIYQ